MHTFNGKIFTKFNVSVLVTALVCLAPLFVPASGKRAQNKDAAGGRVSGAYITVSTDERVADKLVAEKLIAAGIKDVLSESSQWFFLNDFSELRQLPLDQFSDFLLETDPRNDGYAERLRAVFVRDGRRYFYIPRSSLRSSNYAVIERRISDALEDTPYSLAISSVYSVNNVNNGLIFVPAALFSLLLSVFVSKSLSRYAGRGRFITEFTLMTAALLPACSLFARRGPAGFALASVTLAFFITLREPLKFFFIRMRLEGGFSVSRLAHIKQFLLKERKIYIFMFMLFVVICITGRLNISYALSAVLFCCLSAAAYFLACTMPQGRSPHLRFVPVDIRPRRENRRRITLAALPFTLASVAAIGMPFVRQANPQMLPRLFTPDPGKGIPAVDADNYKRHIDFQKTFSFRKLGGAVNEDLAYAGFEVGGDGLLHPAAGNTPDGTGIGGGASAVPPFPLEELIAFLNEEDGEAVVSQDLDVGGLIAVMLALLLYVPNFSFTLYRNGKKERNTLYISQSVTA
jgi:hypothetical protein